MQRPKHIARASQTHKNIEVRRCCVSVLDIHRSEGFPLTCIFSWAGWDWDLACSNNSSVAVAVAAVAVAVAAVARLTTLPRLPRLSADYYTDIRQVYRHPTGIQTPNRYTDTRLLYRHPTSIQKYN